MTRYTGRERRQRLFFRLAVAAWIVAIVLILTLRVL